MNKIFFGFLFLLISVSGSSNERLSPVDESSEDPSFVAFKKDLIEAIRKHNSTFIKKILADDVQYTFGADPDRKSAVDGFLKHYKVAEEKNSKFWSDLQSVIDLGCTKSESAFSCPYVYSKWPDKFDSFKYVVTVKEKTPIREKPQALAKIIRIAIFEILKFASDQPTGGWYAIDLGDKKVGFVSQSDARGPADYRAEFNKISTGWKLKYFIAGD